MNIAAFIIMCSFTLLPLAVMLALVTIWFISEMWRDSKK